MSPTDDHFLELALIEARKAAEEDEVPVGAVAVFEGQVVGTGRNARERRADPLAHAELEAIREASRTLGRWRLTGVTLYVTLEPCAMCAGAVVNARVDRLVYGASDPKAGAVGSLYELCTDRRLNHRVEVVSGVRAVEAGTLLTEFFRRKRAAAR
ncbi:tRNA adenosine(34) deaminase TadA [Vulgatibacter incomptus]|uniref:tRNA-specific adenosine deaminase n=1 Tax=Vulgatibacter incomptus TaxID=1391653 RepID=A0A0K1P851_9BACT|nr:tRNA adenosine(34) deaminase TadA [Vulgatibacter incomptus]AKU89687.1 tRNA-specific adenosine-34 deaminase [Vulgatibacter incomptus]